METSRLARSFVFASFMGTALVGGAALDAAVPEEAEAGYDIDESYFYASLSSQGSWVQNAQFGWVWYPYQRNRYWRPYTVGSWVWTDYGEWLWVSDEPFGWATYHYGRWFLDPFYGWVWLPGRVWAPAWVSWRDGGDYIGWSPLGPWGYWDDHRNCYRDRYYHGHYDGDYDDGNHHNGRPDYDRDRRYRDNQDTWNFTRKRDFASARVDKVVIDRQHLPEVYRKSRDLPPPSEQEEREGRGTTRAIDKTMIERAAGRPIRPVKVEDGDAPTASGKRGASPDRVRVYRPKVNESKPDAPTPDKLGIAKVPDKAARPAPQGGDAGDRNARDARNRVTSDRAPGRGRAATKAREDSRPAVGEPAPGGKPAKTEQFPRDPTGREEPAHGGTPTRQPRSPGRDRGDDGAPGKATQPASKPGHPLGGGSGGQRIGKPEAGAYERPARPDERGGYERSPRAGDGEGHERSNGDSKRGGPQQPVHASEPRGYSLPPRQPSQGQQPSRVEQPSHAPQPSRMPQASYGQQPSRVQQPSHGSNSAPRGESAPAPQRAPAPSGGSPGGVGSPQGYGPSSHPQQGSSQQGSRGGSNSSGIGNNGPARPGGSLGGRTGAPPGQY